MSAADQLLGLSLANGWKVTGHLARNPNGTGGTFSQSYIAEKNGKIGFVKAFDFWEAFKPGVDTVTAIQILTAAYNHECDVLDHCGTRRLSKVVLAIDKGYVQVPGMGAMEGRVYYLIFEKAEGDVRCQMDTNKSFDALWCMRALKDVSLGLWQVHKEMIAHQDAKPSNVLLYRDDGFKIADFGRSSRRDQPAHHDNYKVAGDRSYAPPELLYGFAHSDFVPRRIGCDLYMLGNLAAFLFSGVNITANLLSHLDKQHHPRVWTGTYDEVLPYLQNSFARVLEDIAPKIDKRVRPVITSLIEELCTPDLARRGHPRGLGRHDQYSLERYVSILDLAAKKIDIQLRIERQTA
jgi:serine/threonine protein kinase